MIEGRKVLGEVCIQKNEAVGKDSKLIGTLKKYTGQRNTVNDMNGTMKSPQSDGKIK